jgi:hypothetical protein
MGCIGKATETTPNFDPVDDHFFPLRDGILDELDAGL